MPRLTILMPAYNAERFIRETIDSLLVQTFTDFELWIVDDGSKDRTRAIAALYSDPRLKIFQNEVNMGRDAVVNKWVQKITTPFFTITDADDVSHPQRLQKQMKLLEADDTMMMCGSSYSAMSEEGILIHTTILPADIMVINENLHKHAQFLGATTIMRKKVMEEIIPFYRSGYFEADADLCCRIIARYKATNCKEPLYYYRIVNNSMSRKGLTPAFLNSYKIIFWLYNQRIKTGTDVLQTGDIEELRKYIHSIEQTYTPDFLQRHTAFYHLYWGLTSLALKHGFAAIIASPFYIKNYFAFCYIILRSGLFSLNRAVNKKHYTACLNKPA